MVLVAVLLACDAEPVSPRLAPPAELPPPPTADVEPADPGLVVRPSPHDVLTTVERLRATAEAMGLTVFDVVDHAANAEGAGLSLPPTQVIRVGNPKIGTPLMECGATVAIDLPQRILVHVADGGTEVVYNDPAWLAGRHALSPCGDAPLTKVEGALSKLVEQATAEDAE